jgi:hypothetical protein
MITTVTTTTTTVLNSAAAGSLALILTFGLILLLLQREFSVSLTRPWTVRLRAMLQVAIIPLVLVFVVTAATRLALIFR